MSLFSYFMTTLASAAKLVDAQGLRVAKIQEVLIPAVWICW